MSLSTFASSAGNACRTLIGFWRGLIAIEARPYAPEKHYMRGPGPKWREKHAHEGRSR